MTTSAEVAAFFFADWWASPSFTGPMKWKPPVLFQKKASIKSIKGSLIRNLSHGINLISTDLGSYEKWTSWLFGWWDFSCKSAMGRSWHCWWAYVKWNMSPSNIPFQKLVFLGLSHQSAKAPTKQIVWRLVVFWIRLWMIMRLLYWIVLEPIVTNQVYAFFQEQRVYTRGFA